MEIVIPHSITEKKVHTGHQPHAPDNTELQNIPPLTELME